MYTSESISCVYVFCCHKEFNDGSGSLEVFLLQPRGGCCSFHIVNHVYYCDVQETLRKRINGHRKKPEIFIMTMGLLQFFLFNIVRIE